MPPKNHTFRWRISSGNKSNGRSGAGNRRSRRRTISAGSTTSARPRSAWPIAEPERKGYLKKQQGKGTFVTFSSQGPGMAVRTMLTEDLFGGGVNIRKEMLINGT